MRKNTILIGCILSLLFFGFQTPSLAADKTVVVTNSEAEPVPVSLAGDMTVTVNNSGAEPVPVSLTGDMTVTVTNTEEEPLPVVTQNERNIRTPFGERLSVAFGIFKGIATSDRVAGDVFIVPENSILVAEHISLRATMSNADDIGYCEVRFFTNGTSMTHYLPVNSDVVSLPVGSTQKITSLGWPIKLYFDAGSDVTLNLNSIVGSPGGSVIYSLSGYLVPLSSPLLSN